MKNFITTSAFLTCFTLLAATGLHAEELCYEAECWEAPPAPCEVVDPCFEPPVRPSFIGVPTYLPAPPIYRPMPRRPYAPQGSVYVPGTPRNILPDVRRQSRTPYGNRNSFRNDYRNPREQARGPYIPQGDRLRQPYQDTRYRPDRFDRNEFQNNFARRNRFAPDASASVTNKEDFRSKKRRKKGSKSSTIRRNLISLLLN